MQNLISLFTYWFSLFLIEHILFAIFQSLHGIYKLIRLLCVDKKKLAAAQ